MSRYTLRMLPQGLIVLTIIGLLWLLLTQFRLSAWFIGAPAVLFAALFFVGTGTHRPPARSIRLAALPRFSYWFIVNSLRGGFDVAARAFAIGRPMQPGYILHHLSIADGPARVFLINCISLLPGTLCVNTRGNELVLHVLDSSLDIANEISDAERQVQRLFHDS